MLANLPLDLWELPCNAQARLINLSENATYLVEAPNWKSILRVHRETYHSRLAIGCELAWLADLNRNRVVAAPDIWPGRDGGWIQTRRIEGLPGARHMVMFRFVEGRQPDKDQDLSGLFVELGEMAAKTHCHAARWCRPEPFERLVWNLDAIFGPQAIWGDWRAAPHITKADQAILERTEAQVRRRIDVFGTKPERYGLIHADMRLANLLVSEKETHLIDFDDCGMGWCLYDFAASISFMEDSPQIPMLKEAWIKGYQKFRTLPEEDIAEIDSFIMLRRLALLAWIGSHIEVPEAQKLAESFPRISAELGEIYLLSC